jgi:glycosyltransferase involved in cell wall biosynthesis
MKILVVTQYFWPENFRINDLVLGLKEKGHYVEVLTGKPNYPTGKFFDGYTFFANRTEYWNGIKVNRAPLIPRGNSNGIKLMFNYLSFATFATLRSFSLKGDFDKILVYEPSPITVGIPAIALKYRKKAKIYFWVQDIWPHSVTAAGGVSNKLVLSILNSLTKWIYKKSNKILIQSEAFRKLIISQEVEENKIEFYPNSVEEIFKVLPKKEEYKSLMPNGFNILFAGNIGEAQDFETIVEAAKIVATKEPLIKWVILGDGRKREYLEDKIVEYNLERQIYLLGSYALEKMPNFYACADALLVSLKKDYIFSLTIPSKIQSYLACGKPILASLDGEGARIIANAEAGFIANAQNPNSLAEQALKLYNMPKEILLEMGQNGRKYFESNFERDLLVNRLEEIFAK